MISHLQTILAKDPFYVKETRFVDISPFVQLARKYLKAHVETTPHRDVLMNFPLGEHFNAIFSFKIHSRTNDSFKIFYILGFSEQ